MLELKASVREIKGKKTKKLRKRIEIEKAKQFQI